jgi:protoheme IX farnesyltransferase
MALVVTARSAVEAQTGRLPTTAPATRHRRLAAVLPWLAAAGALAFAAALVAERASLVAPFVDWLEPAGLAINAGAAVLALAACIVAWVAAREDTGLLLAVTLAPLLAALRAVSTGLLLTLDLSTLADVADTGLGLLVLGCLVWAATTSAAGRRAGGTVDLTRAALFRRVAEITAFVVFALGLSGATVRAAGASWACSGTFPDCNGLGWLPFGRDPVADIQLYHRLLSYAALALVAWVTVEVFRTQRGAPLLSGAALVLLGTILFEGAIGAAVVSLGNPPVLQVLHTAGAALSWSAVVVLVALAHRTSGVRLTLDGMLGPYAGEMGPKPLRGGIDEPPGGVPRVGIAPAVSRAPAALSGARVFSARQTLSAYVQLTKPRVMSLLLATTATAMVIAARGMPPLGLFLATLFGGALMSGGAGAINHYVDRDIDPLMGRTAWRPIPSGVISPNRALWFGITLALLASVVLVAFVNVLACLLSLVGLLGYVFIYTLWLKRSTPSNIVIGGAAGAIPPLVGWAAVTNEVSSLTAWYLFAIIFFWTPPHFWALSLLIRDHYARAGVPMLPVVRGEGETRRQIVLYSVLLVVLTLVLSPFGMMGGVYFAAALVLGAVFLVQAVRLYRQATRQAARRLYLYSILYLFALFAAMAVDRVVSS